jgi:hypothetical protein
MSAPTLAQREFENLLNLLTTRQHLWPHESVSESMSHTIGDLGVCPNAIAQSLERLNLDANTSIGRLRRTELMQLARTVYRYWRAAEPTAQHAT